MPTVAGDGLHVAGPDSQSVLEAGGALPGVPPVLNRSQAGHDGAGDLALLQHQVAAHGDDLADRLYADRARLLAGAAGGACPQLVFGHHPVNQSRAIGVRCGLSVPLASEQSRPLLHQVSLELLDQLLGREGLPGEVRGTDLLASPAAGAGVEVEQVLPGQVLDLRRSEGLEVSVISMGLRTPLPFRGLRNMFRGEATMWASLREAEEDVGHSPEGYEHVAPPQPLVQDQGRVLRRGG